MRLVHMSWPAYPPPATATFEQWVRAALHLAQSTLVFPLKLHYTQLQGHNFAFAYGFTGMFA